MTPTMAASLKTRYLKAHKQLLHIIEQDLPELGAHSRTGRVTKEALEALITVMDEVGVGLDDAIELTQQVDADVGFKRAREVLAMFLSEKEREKEFRRGG